MSYPESFRLVGPGVLGAGGGSDSLARRDDGPLVLVTASSELQGDDGLVRTALEALGGTDLAVARSPRAAHAPDSSRTQQRRGSSAGSRTCRSCTAPPPSLCHGGMGITQKALTMGVPVCVVPFGRDQFEVAKLVGLSGCGTVVMPDQLNPANLARRYATR